MLRFSLWKNQDYFNVFILNGRLRRQMTSSMFPPSVVRPAMLRPKNLSGHATSPSSGEKGGIVLKGDCHCLNRNGELLHPLHMGSIVQLNEVASDGIALYALDLNRVGKDGIVGLLMVKLPHLVFVGILHIDFTLRQEVSAVRTGQIGRAHV